MKIVKVNAMWCSGCLSMKKIWKEIEKEYPNLEIINYDYDMDSEIVKQYNVGKVLPVVIFENGERLIGEVSKKQIIEMIDKNEV